MAGERVMPYIEDTERNPLDVAVHALAVTAETEGELNYIITTLLWKWLQLTPEGVNYPNINKIIGVLECAKQEFYRRVATPYEDHKLDINGDVFQQ